MGDYIGDITPHAKIGASGQMGEISVPHRYFSSFVTEILLMPGAKKHSHFLDCLIDRASVLGYCIPRLIKLQKLSFLPQKALKGLILLWTITDY